MSILTIVKPTGYNFIRHYLPAFPKGSQVAHSSGAAFSMIPKHDIILFEWANDLTALILNSRQFKDLQDRLDFKTVVRIHDHEVTKVYDGRRRIDAIKWERVDHIWFINPLIQKQFHDLKGDDFATFYLPNAVYPDRFPEHRSTEKKAGLVSLYFRKRKRIDRVIELAKLLPDWEFEIRVEVPYRQGRHEFQLEYEKFEEFRKAAWGIDNIILQNRLVVPTVKAHYEEADLVKWYKDKAVTLSLSDHEGFGYNIAEGAASGCMPVVWNWPGSECFWKPYVVQNAEEAAERIRNYKPSGEYRQYIVDNFHPEKLTENLLNHIL